MRAVKGTIRNGVVSLLEPVELPGEREVMILIPEEGDEGIPDALQYAGMLSDLTAEEKAAFHEALERPIRFSRGAPS
jgi:hypothetical protein